MTKTPSVFKAAELLPLLFLVVTQCSPSYCSNKLPTTVKIGALLAFNSTTGNLAKRTIQLAVQDTNNQSKTLNGSKLELHMFDTALCNPTLGAASAMELLKKEVVAVVGPQSSTVAQFLAHMGESTNVPFVTFGATDPSLSEAQYPFLIRLAHSDRVQLEAVAALIANYGWRQVVALYIDDDYGANGITALGDALQAIGSQIVQKRALAPWIDSVQIGEILAELVNMGNRIFVVHTSPDIGYNILAEAHSLDMVSAEYVWIVTDLIATNLGQTHLDPSIINSTQGIIGTRRYVARSSQLKSFLLEWNRHYSPQEMNPNQLNALALYAYDAVWVTALAISRYLKINDSFGFIDPPRLATVSGGESVLARMKVFQNGSLMRKMILQTNFSGITGLITFDEKGDLQNTAFEFVNMIGNAPVVVGYWTNQSGIISADRQNSTAPTSVANASYLSSIELPIVWPGGGSSPPRGWALPNNGKPLKIVVPQKAGYNEIVSKTVDADNVTRYSGFCIQVFEAALNHLPYAVPYTFEGRTSNGSTPDYDDLIDRLAKKEFDAVIGDVTITAERLRKVSFTQPYIESGLVVLVRVKTRVQKSPWAFSRPFTVTLWSIVLLFFIFTGFVIWILEHRLNEAFRGHPGQQIITVLTCVLACGSGFVVIVSIRFQHPNAIASISLPPVLRQNCLPSLLCSDSNLNRLCLLDAGEETRSALGRLVLVIWLFVVLIISSSYTANLSSMLTVEHLTPTIQGLDSLLQSHFPIGYQTGSFVRNYLINLHVSADRLKNLTTDEQYQRALDVWPERGGVAGIVDELPYIRLFLNRRSCQNYTIAGPEFTKSGWGFAFPRESELTADFSKAILDMSQNGELQQIQDFWFGKQDCEAAALEADTQSSQLNVKNFEGLFIITGMASGLCVLIYIVRLAREYIKSGKAEEQQGAMKELRSFLRYAGRPKRRKRILNLKRPQKPHEEEEDEGSTDGHIGMSGNVV